MYIPLENSDSVDMSCIHVFLVYSPGDSYTYQIQNTIVLECDSSNSVFLMRQQLHRTHIYVDTTNRSVTVFVVFLNIGNGSMVCKWLTTKLLSNCFERSLPQRKPEIGWEEMMARKAHWSVPTLLSPLPLVGK